MQWGAIESLFIISRMNTAVYSIINTQASFLINKGNGGSVHGENTMAHTAKSLAVCTKSAPEVKVTDSTILLQKPVRKDKFFYRAAYSHISLFPLRFCEDGLNGPVEEGNDYNVLG